MTSRTLTLLGYAAIAATAISLQLVALRGRSRIPTFGQVLGRVMRTRAGRIGVIAGWAWFGLHLLAR